MTPSTPMLALFQPDIPQNAGTLMRTCACLGLPVAIIEPAGFPLSDRHFRRAGLDYLREVTLVRHASFTSFETWRAGCQSVPRLVLLSTAGDMDYLDAVYRADDVVMVGRESAGVPPEVHAVADLRVAIRMRPAFRSLNVAVAASMVLGEVLRQVRHVNPDSPVSNRGPQ